MAPKKTFFIDLFMYEMIKYQLNITLYEKNKFVFHTLRYFVESGLLPRNYRNAQWKNAMHRN